jgi:preprotein translocase subunit SecG
MIFIAAALLILIVLVQNSKGGGLASNFTGGNQFGGVAQTNRFLERGTWGLAIALLFFSLVASISVKSTNEVVQESELKDIIENYDYSVPPTVPIENVTTLPDGETE